MLNMFNLLKQSDKVIFLKANKDRITNVNEWNEQIQLLEKLTHDGKWKEDLKGFLEGVYSLLPMNSDSVIRGRVSLTNCLISILDNHKPTTSVSSYMFLQDLHTLLYTDEVLNFDRYLFLLDTVRNKNITKNDLTKEIVWSFKNPHDRHLIAYNEIGIILNKTNPQQLLRILEIFFNLPVTKG